MRQYEQDDNGWATVIGIDPGGTTGWSVMCCYADALADPEVSVLRSIAHWAQGQVAGRENDQIAALVELIAAWPFAAVVVEDFTLRKFTSARELLSPVRITAPIEYVLERGLEGIEPAGRGVFKQQPAMAKQTATDARLREWDLYHRDGEEHARDATRHCITFLRRSTDNKRLRHAAWPYLFDTSGDLLEDFGVSDGVGVLEE